MVMFNAKETKLAVLTGIIALGVFAAAYSSTQMLNAVAQTDGATQASLAGTADAASVSGYPHFGTPTISTSGSATTKVKPDKFSVTVGVETNGTTAQEAADRNADLMAKVIAALKGLGVSDDQISTSNYNVYPVYDYQYPTKPCIDIYPPPPDCQPNNVITGYRASNSATVTLDSDGDIDAGKVIDTAIAAGANNVNGVYFFISQDMQQTIRDNLIKEAIANAQHRAEIAAEAVGTEVTGVQSINLNDVYFPVFYGRSFDTAAEAAPTPILPGEQEITNNVNVVFTIGNSTSTS